MASTQDPFTNLDPDEIRDLGFGERVAGDPTRRLLNSDGTYGAGRHGLGSLGSAPLYEHLAEVSWRKFYVFVVAGFFALDIVFALV